MKKQIIFALEDLVQLAVEKSASEWQTGADGLSVETMVYSGGQHSGEDKVLITVSLNQGPK